MVDMAFLYNAASGQWEECLDERLAHEEIERLEVTLVGRSYWRQSREMVVSSRRHRLGWGATRENGIVKSDDGRVFDGIVHQFDFRNVSYDGGENSPQCFIAPIRYRLFQRTVDSPIFIGADVMLGDLYYDYGLLIDEGFIVCRFAQYQLNIDMVYERILEPKRMYELKGDMHRNYYAGTDIPVEVSSRALELLRKSAERVLGIYPSLTCRMPMERKLLIGFASRPFDVNITYWRDIIGQDIYERSFPREQMDNFRPLCRLLGIEKPPKSLRRGYAFNPYAPLIYILLRRWGIEDVNFIQRFFAYTDRLAGFSLDSFRIDTLEHKITYESDEITILADFKNYIDWVRRHKGENGVVKRLEWMTRSEMGLFYSSDVYRMLREYEPYLSDEVKALLLREGPTAIVHDCMADEVRNVAHTDVWLEYPDEIWDYSVELDDYKFSVVDHTGQLHWIGCALNNCVASYRLRLIEKESIIVIVTCGEKYVACIEVRGQNKIVQAASYGNQKLSGKLHSYVRAWAELKNLEIDVGYLNASSEKAPVQKITAVPGPRELAGLTLAELLAIKWPVPSGYYERLVDLIQYEQPYRLSLPPWQKVASEREYLAYLLPQGWQLLQAAFRGEPHAMFALGRLYVEDKVIPFDYAKGYKWIKKAAAKGYKRAKSYLWEMPRHELYTPEERATRDRAIMRGLELARERIRLATESSASLGA